jgi:PAS domain S-box-containing protein
MLETELFAFLERTADAVFAVTDQGEIRFWNQSAEDLFGYSASEVMSRTCHDVLAGRGPLGTEVCSGGCSIQCCAAQYGKVPNFDLEVRISSGGRLWVNISTIVFDEPRRNRRLIVHLARDISNRKKNEELIANMVDLSKQVAATFGHVDCIERFLRFPNGRRRSSDSLQRRTTVSFRQGCVKVATATVTVVLRRAEDRGRGWQNRRRGTVV